MPDYMSIALANFKHPPHCTPQHAPHTWTDPVYRQKFQYATVDHSAFLLEYLCYNYYEIWKRLKIHAEA